MQLSKQFTDRYLQFLNETDDDLLAWIHRLVSQAYQPYVISCDFYFGFSIFLCDFFVIFYEDVHDVFSKNPKYQPSTLIFGKYFE